MFLLFLLNCYCVLWYFVSNDEIKLYNQIDNHQTEQGLLFVYLLSESLVFLNTILNDIHHSYRPF